MRKYPILKELPTSRDYIDTFGGYNHHLRIGANEFYDMKNLSSDNYPMVSTRKTRNFGKFPEIQGLKLVGTFILLRAVIPIYLNESTLELSCVINGVLFVIGSTQYDGAYERNAVNSGSYITIFPDKFYINTAEATENGDFSWKSLEVKHSSSNVHIKLCDFEGRSITVKEYFDSSTIKVDDFLSAKVDLGEASDVLGTVDDTYYADSHTGRFYYWHPKSKSWLTQDIFIKICDLNSNLEDYFKVGDGIRLSGLAENNANSVVLNDVFDNKLDDSFIVFKFVKNDSGHTEMMFSYHPMKPAAVQYNLSGEITFEKRVPDMDFVIENNNRLWGCRYGKNRDGEIVNEIYASALGDFTNWECFGGTSQDSYIVSLGSEGAFTGAISYLGNPVFFKNNCIHTIQGTYPATYQVQTTECKGVQVNCGKSLAIIDGVLFYKSVGGVSAYTGSLPSEIGMPLNENTRQYYKAVAGVCDGKYYLSVKDKNDKSILFVYDIAKGLWHKEDDLSCDCFVYVPFTDTLYCKSEYTLWAMDSGKEFPNYGIDSGLQKETEIPWFAETGIITCSTPDKKYVSKISIRLSVDVGTRVYVSIEYNSSGVWEQVAAITGTTLNAFTFPVKPKRCDHFRLKIEGTDSAKIYSISKTIEQGSDK